MSDKIKEYLRKDKIKNVKIHSQIEFTDEERQILLKKLKEISSKLKESNFEEVYSSLGTTGYYKNQPQRIVTLTEISLSLKISKDRYDPKKIFVYIEKIKSKERKKESGFSDNKENRKDSSKSSDEKKAIKSMETMPIKQKEEPSGDSKTKKSQTVPSALPEEKDEEKNPGKEALNFALSLKNTGDKKTLETSLKELARLIVNYNMKKNTSLAPLKTIAKGSKYDFNRLNSYSDRDVGHIIAGARHFIKANMKGMKIEDSLLVEKDSLIGTKKFYEASLCFANFLMKDKKKEEQKKILAKFKSLRSSISHIQDRYIILDNIALFYPKISDSTSIKKFIDKIVEMFSNYKTEEIQKFIRAVTLHMDAIVKGIKDVSVSDNIEKIIDNFSDSNLNKLKKLRTIIVRAGDKYELIRRLSLFTKTSSEEISKLVKLSDTLDLNKFKEDFLRALLIKEGNIAEKSLREEAITR